MSAKAKEIEAARRRRGFPRRTITKASNTIKDLERRSTDPDVPRAADRALRNIENADVDFKKLHLATIELIESEEDLVKEQAILDEHEAIVEDLIGRVTRLLIVDPGTTAATPDPDPRRTAAPDPRRIATKRLERIETKLAIITDNVSKLSSKPDDKYIVHQWEEQLQEVRLDLSDVAKTPVMLDLDPKDDLLDRQSKLESFV